MPAKLPFNFCCGLVTLCVLFTNPLRASVAYISNCCNHPSTVTVVDTGTGRQKAQWTVGTDAFQAVFSPDGRFAYVSDTVSEAVTVVQVSTGYVLATIPVGYQILWMAITPDGRILFAESYDYAYESHIVAIDTVTNTIRQVAGFAALLSPMVVSPDGRTLYVDSSFSAQPGLLVIDTLLLTVRTTIPMGAANGLAISPDGRFVYVPNLGSGGPYNPNVAVVDTSTNTVSATIPLNTKLNPGPAQMSPDGSMLWESEFPLYNNVDPVIVLIATATNQLVGQITLLGKKTPGAIAFSPDGKTAWVVADGSAVQAVNVASLTAVSEVDSLGSTNGPAVSPDGKTLLLPNTGDSQVAAIGVPHGGRLASIAAGAMNWSTSQNPLFVQGGGVAASPDGTRLYVTNYSSNNVSVIDAASKRVTRSVEVGASPVAVAVSPDGSKAYVANSFANSVSVINTKTFATTQIVMPRYTYPSALAITPDGSHLYVAGNNPVPDFGSCGCRVFVIDTASNTVVNSIRLDYPQAMTVSPDGAYVYVVSAGTALYTISTTTNKVISTMALKSYGPVDEPATSGIAMMPDGVHLFVDDGGDNKVFEIDVTQHKVVATILVGNVPGILALTPDSSQLWAGDYYSTSASVVDVARGKVIGTVPLGSQSYGIAFAPQ